MKSLVCMCIHLPESVDAPYYLQQLVVRREQVARLYEGRTAPGLGMLPRLTYPQLRQPLPMIPALVYVAWKGHLRWAHTVADTAPLDMDHLGNMDEALAAQMQIGSPYLWVFSTPHRIPTYPAPPGYKFGRVAQTDHLQDNPTWRRLVAN
jgi:hypothetical protein